MSVTAIHAQREPRKLFAEISIGPSIPLGQFAEKSYDGQSEKDQPGMAGIGQSLNMMLGYYLKENAGLLLSAGHSSYKQESEGYAEYFKRRYYVNATEVDVETNSWKLLKVMAGGFLVTPLAEDKLNLITKLSAGICKTAVPQYSYRAYRATGPAFAGGEEKEVKLPAALCYQISLGVQYKLNDKLHLLFDLNSFNATAKKDVTVLVDGPPPVLGPGSGPGPMVPTTVNKKYKFGSVNALLGVGLTF